MTEISSTLRKRFSKQEDKILKHAVDEQGLQNWDEIAQFLPGRTGRQCRDRYNNYLFKEISGKPWSPEEDEIIQQKYQIYGSHWVKISQFLEGRSGNNVKNRWYKYLSKKDQNKTKNQIFRNENFNDNQNNILQYSNTQNCLNDKVNNNFINNEVNNPEPQNDKSAKSTQSINWDRTLNEEDFIFDLIQDTCDWCKDKQGYINEHGWFD